MEKLKEINKNLIDAKKVETQIEGEFEIKLAVTVLDDYGNEVTEYRKLLVFPERLQREKWGIK